MIEPDRLKLLAMDDEDLAVISAHVQDAVLKVADLVNLPKERRFALGMNRFIWEKAEGQRKGFERRPAALTFDRVLSVQTSRIRRDRPEAVLELLAIAFEPEGEAPAGNVTLHFAGGGAIRLAVECIEARLADLGTAWATRLRPSHDVAADGAGA
ncbi:MAG: DUF2948 family protein [Rhizobiales bacterium]|nr:DUF2948 family protein [Hyphomicrobiales bacterium]